MRRAWQWLIGTVGGRIVLGIVALLVVLRIALPFVVVSVANRQLEDLDGYRGRIDSVDIRLIRGAYRIHDLEIEMTDGKVPVPFLSVDTIGVGISWGALIHGKLVADILIEKPVVNFVQGRTEEDTQYGYDDWQETIEEIIPIRIDRFRIRDGEVHFRDFQSEPQIDLYVHQIAFDVRNLVTRREMADETPVAPFALDALVQGSGRLRAEGSFNPLADEPRLDLDLKLVDLDITKLNDLLQAYINVDAENGTLATYLEATVADGHFEGYVKPMIHDLEIFEWDPEEKGFLGQLWEGAVAAVAWVLENQREDQIATRVPVRGELDDPGVGVWAAVWALLRNAFIEALSVGLEGSVDVTELRQRLAAE
jgi:uncharacterized protein YhdP